MDFRPRNRPTAETMRGIGLRRGKLVRHRWAYIVVFGLISKKNRDALPRNIEFFLILI